MSTCDAKFHLIISSFGIITQKRCTFPWSAHLEAFALELAQNPEYASDQSIIHLVRLQHVLEEMDQVSPDTDSLEMEKTGKAFQHTFRTFKTEIEQFSNQLPSQPAANNYLLTCQLHTVKLYLCQLSLFECKSISQIPPNLRAEIVCHGLAAAKASFDDLISIPVGSERCFCYGEWLQTGFNIILSCKLALMALSDEELRQSHPHARSLCDALDMPRVLKTCVDRQLAHRSRGSSQKTGFDYVGWLQWIQEWFGRHYNRYLTRQAGEETNIAPPSTTAVDYPSQPVQLNMGDMGSLGVAENMLQWPMFTDMGQPDNPLAGWMDLNLIPM
ncbi:uncharacterized protein BDV17DRAFT_276545 [Aspergillus undulatus]|uniref:uncharacterized protein n=1 Tax=Aspergillus undulatus TaxID=1810928 RepID=UPI003CCDD8C7